MKSIGIIGAGPAGLTAGHELARMGMKVEFFEASPHVGGLSRTIDLWGHKVDLGPHRFFSRDPRINQFWDAMVGEDVHYVDRLTRIYFKGRFFDYPLRPLNALKNLGPFTALACAFSYLGGRLKPKHPATSFEDWVVSAFGRRLFEIFFKTYSEKLWGIRCDELDVDFAAQRIKQFSLGQAALSMLKLRPNQHQTLVDRFKYPTEGAGMVYDRMAENLRRMGAVFHLSTPVAGIAADGKSLQLADGSTRQFDEIISTMPLTVLCRSLPGLPEHVRAACDSLTYRNTLLVYVLVEGADLFPDQWLYVHSENLRFGRITNFSNWSPGIRGDLGQTVLAMEYWCTDGDDICSMPEAELQALALRELDSTRLIGGSKVLDSKVIRIPKSYPVYRKGYRKDLAVVTDYLRTAARHVTAIGRYGAFKYNNQDHSILMGLLAADNLGQGTQHDLHAINTDYGTYQEQAPEQA